jgi:predicted CXXCH cytochrome family protein
LAAALLGHGADILSPTPGSLFGKGPVRVIARGDGKAELRLDGKGVPAERPADGVITATVNPGAGPHEIALGEEKVRFVVGEKGGGESAAFKEHPPVANCQTCHAVKNGVWSLQRASLVSLCFPCHDKEKFPKAHTHVPGILTDCQLCHNAHGSNVKGFLTLPRETACKQCHN